MSEHSYTTSITVDQSPEEAFAAINNIRGWWSQAIEGDTDRLDAVFYYHYKNLHRCTIKVTELVRGRKVAWHILHNAFDFVEDTNEWNGTEVVFEIARKGDKTEVRFTHVGLVPAYECYEVCSDAWGTYIRGSLRDLIATGLGKPNPIDEVLGDEHTQIVARTREMRAAS
jgi:hypothetical protein